MILKVGKYQQNITYIFWQTSTANPDKMTCFENNKQLSTNIWNSLFPMENFNFIESMIEAGVQTTNLMEQSHVPSVVWGK